MGRLSRLCCLPAAGLIILHHPASASLTGLFIGPPSGKCSVAQEAIGRKRLCDTRGVDPSLRVLNTPDVPQTSRPVSSEPSPSKWHTLRRSEILRKYPEVKTLIGNDDSTIPLLVVADLCLMSLSCFCGASEASVETVSLLALTVGGWLSLVQFSCLHDCLHGTASRMNRKDVETALFWGSLPSMFGYFLYLQFGHMSHHKGLGSASLSEVFASSREDFEDGDVLFVAHRQEIEGGDPPISIS
eukprot:Cvel_31791.t1-p1 / transcript=Cvel_31791.t1 / gene=Cvel_31791 / organism=Chromera_velia_CCMP2878 / gene_product=Putative sphingolipid, putative / transcript_product=Putative sphingolipid, putative / location=Cvel_scaffold4802:5105-7008(+) / protein_length=242 / sequence_SO=supercontig / SO=protein_coding / is_pseudo=false